MLWDGENEMKMSILKIVSFASIALVLMGCNGAAALVGSQTSSLPPQTSSLPPQTSSAANSAHMTFEGTWAPPEKGQAINTIFADPHVPVPNIIVVTMGTTVTWVSRAFIAITIVSNLFTGDLPPTGGVFSYTFNEPGVCVYEFEPFGSSVTGEVIVLDLGQTNSVLWQMLTDSTLRYYE